MQRRPLLLAALSGLIVSGSARSQPATEARVKARIALNLARFTIWPAQVFAEPDAPHLWCATARDGALAEALAALVGETVGGRPIRLQHHAEPGSACQVLYVDALAEARSTRLLAGAAHAPVLSIGDGEGFSRRGIVGLVNVNDSVRFDINLTLMRAAQLSISSQVLRLARRVHE